ncbi:hypothetical protein DYB31_006167 [Aphanomyces astaci]|uniref:Chromodomain-helicase-DNA-binding protein 6 n=1 Tax=Aphanomyces astaci TaxID=112090 RepID=A0A397ET19_APHAT|nr:hypothetical protein DYB31_006167 [Aphanomyces astaci]
MADKRKHVDAAGLLSSDDEINETNLRKRLRLAPAVSSKSRTATQRSSKKTTTKQDHSNSNSSDTDDFVAEVSSSSKRATKKKKAASTAAKSKKNKAGPAKAKKRNVQPKRALSSSHDDDSYNSSNDSAKATSFSRKKGKKPHDDSTDSDELFRKLPRGGDESDDGDECFIVDKVLAKETHTAAEWAKKCRGMHTHYVSLGSIFVDDDDDDEIDDDHRPTQDDIEPKDVAAADDDEDAPGIEKFLIKWRNLSYLHVTWETESALVEYEKNAKGKLQRFQDRTAKLLLLDEAQGDEYFNPEFCTVDRILNVQPSDVDDGKGGFQLEYYVKWKALPYDECTWEQEVDVHDDAAVQLYHAFNKEPPPPSSAASLKRTTAQFRPYNADNPIRFKTDLQQLRDYQVEGVNWMIFNWYNHRNSLLADEMGLGKTVQTVAYINHLVTKENLRGPYLIIAPLSTLSHWQREASSNHHQQPQYRFDVLITTFEMCTANDYLTLARIKWQLAVVDEAHRLKNKKSKLSSVLEDRFQYENLLLLTGTPLQNNVEELWTLLHFLDSDKFQSASDFVDLFGELKDSSQVEKLHKELKPFLLRRMKEDVEKSLAPKEETIIEVELTVFQKQYYRAIYEKNSQFLARGGKKAHAPSLMNVVMELRKCCNHPFLIRGAEEREVMRLQKQQPRNLPLSTRREAVHKQLNDLLVTSCGKLVLLDKLLPRLRDGGHRVLIFSQFKIMLNILEDYLRMRGYPRERIDGSITGNDRQAAIDRYCDPHRDSFVMLLSTRAGGVGINLTAADTCIIYDSDWNPQNDLQAQARCHRIGQKKSVKVYRLLTSKTYELHMFHQASMKLGLDQAVLGGIRQVQSAAKGGPPSKEEIESLLKYGAYEMFKEDDADAASKKFNEESVDEILKRSKTVVHDPKKDQTVAAFGSSFSKATFVSSENPAEQVALDDPDFWIKVIGLTGVAESNAKHNKTPEKRRCKGRKTYKEIGSDEDRHDADGEYKVEDEASESSSDDDDTADAHHGPSATGEVKAISATYSNTALLTYGYGRWTKIRMSDPILTNFPVVKIKDYAMGFMVQMLRVASMDPHTNHAAPTSTDATAVNQQQLVRDAMNKMALKYKFVVYWLQVLHRESNNQSSQSREMFNLHEIPVQEELTRLNVVASLAKTAGKYLQLLDSLFVLDQFVSKRLSPMLEVMAILNTPYNSDSSPLADNGDVPSTVARNLVEDLEDAVDAKEPFVAADACPPPANPPTTTAEDEGDTTSSLQDGNVHPSTAASPSKVILPPDVVAKWTHYFGALYKMPAIPVVQWWSSPHDDVRLLYIVHRYGWLRGTKAQFQQIRTDRLLFPPTHPGGRDNAPWPSIATLNKRVKAIIRYWADKSIQSVLPTAPPPPVAPRLAPPPLAKATVKSASHAFLQHMWERRSRFMGLLMSHGVPDVRLCTNALEEREKWRYFLFDPVLRAKHFSPQELLAEATSLEAVCISFLGNTKPLKSTERSVFGAYRHDWVVTHDQARGILYRLDLFRILRQEVLVLRPAELHATMAQVVGHVHQVQSAPSWWKSPECDILLMQCYGLDDHIKDMWQLDLFQRLNPSQSFPSVSWVDSTVMTCAKAVVRTRRAAEAALEEQQRQQAIEAARVQAEERQRALLANDQAKQEAGREAQPVPAEQIRPRFTSEPDVERAAMALEDPHCNTKAFMWYLLQKKEAELRSESNKVEYRARRDDIHRQIEHERQAREEELKAGLGTSQPGVRAPEVIEIDDDSE